MDIKVAFSEEPAFVLNTAGEFLASRPVLHNLILSLLHARVAQHEPGRYWVAMERGKAVGVVLQSPLTFAATLTPMDEPVVVAMVDAIAETGISLPGVNGAAATAASFAGHWTERCKSAATPFQGNRIYELLEMGKAPNVEGRLRQAEILWRAALNRAAELSQSQTPELGTRALDVLHVACAIELKSRYFLTFDQRQQKLAAAAGLRRVQL